MPSAAAIAAHRRDLFALTQLAERDVEVAVASIDNIEAFRDLLLRVVPGLLDAYGEAAAALAADWYEDVRAAENVRGRFRPVLAEPFDDDRAEALVRWGVAPLFKPEPDFASAKTLIRGGLQRNIADSARYTVAGSAVADPGARGWRRVGTGRNCEFCNMLISRGAVYTESSAEFKSHDHCNCAAAPVFE